ncbi:HAMP domain-containing protein [Deinococcus ficus]|uniref:HAMP domain-containing protein n=1 Tax=Deinococcus ficus TaxID=317577 RepID=A0A221T301_9DEIO|nr:HAMP domain-containing protein [Deinococcus ficus]ASN83226.1 HAMP domain-containing protein [Deinococcus ficus]
MTQTIHPTTTLHDGVPAAIAPRKHGSVRPTLLALALLPALVTGILLTTYNSTTQPEAQRRLILDGAAYSGKSFSGRVDDLMENIGQSLENAEVLSTLQVRTEELVTNNDTRTLALTDAVITDTLGNIKVAHNKDYELGLAATEANVGARWVKENPELAKLVTHTAQKAQTTDNQATAHFVRDGIPLLISAVPFTTHVGTTVFVIDERTINNYTRAGVRNNIALTALILALTSVLGVLAANRLSRRIRNISLQARRISQAHTVEELKVPIVPSGNDELTTLEEDLDLLRETTVIMVEQAEEESGALT